MRKDTENMIWKYERLGSHTHVRVYVNGAYSGTLIFTYEEFENIKNIHRIGGNIIDFVPIPLIGTPEYIIHHDEPRDRAHDKES